MTYIKPHDFIGGNLSRSSKHYILYQHQVYTACTNTRVQGREVHHRPAIGVLSMALLVHAGLLHITYSVFLKWTSSVEARPHCNA